MNAEKFVICMKWGTKFGPEYVNRLFRMVKKNLSIDYRFVCFTDDPSGLIDEVEVFPLLENIPIDPQAPERGWRKLSVFANDLYGLKGTALFLDLDIVIRNNIDELFSAPGEFLIIKDWDFPNDIIGNSSVFRFEIGKYEHIIEQFTRNKSEIIKRHRNEQAFLSYAMHEMGVLQYWPSEWCVSFKRHCLQSWPMCYFKEPIDPIHSKIIIFHGKPTPDEAYHGYIGKYGFRYIKPTKWLEKYW